MQKFYNLKQTILLVGLMMPTVWCGANNYGIIDGFSGITIKEAQTQGAPKGNTIKASIDGHYLTVIFTENIGPVTMEITTAAGATVQTYWVYSPDGLQTYIPQTGDYIITFTLSNGDEYYGEFTVTD